MSESNEIAPDPRLEKRSRRRFSVPERKRLLAEADALPHGQKGAWLRRNGLYAAQLSTWRKELAEFGEAALAERKPGRQPADSRDKEIERLKKEKARLEQRVYVAEQLVELQKNRPRGAPRSCRRRNSLRHRLGTGAEAECFLVA